MVLLTVDFHVVVCCNIMILGDIQVPSTCLFLDYRLYIYLIILMSFVNFRLLTDSRRLGRTTVFVVGGNHMPA